MAAYTPITTTEFRIVHVLPGRFADPLRCILEIRPSEIKTSYEALSYEWGAESVATRLIDIAHHASPSRVTEVVHTQPSNSILSRAFDKAWQTARSAAIRYVTIITLVLTCISSIQLWRWASPILIDSPGWSKWMIYVAFGCLVCGFGIVDLFIKAIQLMSEMTRTKPWLLLLDGQTFVRAGVLTDDTPGAFGATAVTPNLELALRHLRLERRRRTLWIDALCINQEDEEEKRVQVQRMDLIYANASSVLIWLGDYHGIGTSFRCPEPEPDELSRECKHRQEISEAFDFIRSVTGPSGLISKLLRRRDQEERFRAALPGFLSIVQRGWWKRLWVIQEAALGTAKIYIHCGDHTCDFEKFETAQAMILRRADLNTDTQAGFRWSKRFVSVFHEFRYSSYYEPPKGAHEFARLMTNGLRFVIDSVFGRIERDRREIFHEQAYPDRLLRVLLKTAGHFECRDERDRLTAVLGIVGGTRKVPTLTASFIEFCSDINNLNIVGQGISSCFAPYYKDSAAWPFFSITFGLLLASWSYFYDERAKNWTISRPEYVMTSSKEILEAVEGKKEARDDQGAFFCALAYYIASRTRSLAFLEAAPCGEDNGLPSWVPIWRNEVNDSAYDFAAGDKHDLATDLFHFTDEGKTLELVGQDFGRVREVKTLNSLVLQSSPTAFLFDKLFVLPADARRLFMEVICSSAAAFSDTSKLPEALPVMLEAFKALRLALEKVNEWLQTHGKTVIHCHKAGKDSEEEVGFVKNGEARRGDRIVAVPGCYHHLVLRNVSSPGGAPRWKLVGTVLLLKTLLKRDEERGYTKTEWERLLKGRELNRFAIV